jgi:hypothetical protein
MRRRKTPKRRIVNPATSSTADLTFQSLHPGSVSEHEENYLISTIEASDVQPPSLLNVGKSPSAATKTLIPSTPIISTPMLDAGPSNGNHHNHHHNLHQVWMETMEQDPRASRPDWGANTDLYRQRIATLHDRVGHGYLGVLGEESWDGSRRSMRGMPDSLHGSTNTIMAAAAQPIHSGRTLG